jgi:hypothetical protein
MSPVPPPPYTSVIPFSASARPSPAAAEAYSGSRPVPDPAKTQMLLI